MDRRQNTRFSTASSAPAPGYRGPFTLGLSRLSRVQARQDLTSRQKAMGCFALSMAFGVLAAQGLSSTSIPLQSALTMVASGGPVTPIPMMLLLGGLGLGMSISLSIGGLWLWPFKYRVKVQPCEESLAAYDHVTGLPTVRLFMVLLDQALTRASHMGRRVGILVAELQQFSPLSTSVAVPNLSLIVRVQAARIKSALSSTHTVARIDDRRFAILIEDAAGLDQIEAPAQNIYLTMSLPLMIEGQEVLLSCQIGGAVSSADTVAGTTLLSEAVRALGQATSDDPIRVTDDAMPEPRITSSAAENKSSREPLLR